VTGPAPAENLAGAFAGKGVVITGAGTGLGASCAVAFARRGAGVVLVGRRADKLEQTARAVGEVGGKAEVVAGDVALEATATAAAVRCVDAFGGVDVLVNNAGIHAHPLLVHETPVAEFDEFLAVDLRGPFLFTRAVVPSMIERGGGAILNVSSMVALVGFKYGAAYSAAKGGLISLTRTTAVDYAAHGIRVNCICPGGMEPVERGNLVPGDYDRLYEAVAGAGGALITSPCHVDDMAEFVVFLCGPHVPTLTGAVIPVDGGFSAH
jgi:NAD(P)-dependent dehydrogenase (short-subunit alcohol dehydrogenase family)